MAYNPNDPTPKWIQEVGGHECPKHGRYYGTCASCQHDSMEKGREEELSRLRAIEQAARKWLEADTKAEQLEDDKNHANLMAALSARHRSDKAREALRKLLEGGK